MKKYAGYLVDLDGTVYNGTEKIEDAVNFINALADSGIPYLFLTNNSTKHPRDVAAILEGMGMQAEESQVFTTSMATAKYVSDEKPGAKVFAIGEEGLHFALEDAGLTLTEEDAEYVVMGLHREITYEMLAKGALLIRKGAKFVATNSDVALPSERGFLPGAGSLISVLSVSTGVEPTFIGKPEAIIVEQALDVLGTAKMETLMVGDNYDTDILAGIRAGIDTLLVYTGVTTKEALKKVEEKPTYQVNSLADWNYKGD